MSGTFYFKLAATGISKNRKMYFPYLLTCVCMVMMYYIISFLCRSSTLREMHGGDTVQQMLSLGVNVIAVFSLIFLYYTNSFLIRRRQREFGLYHILGMGKRNLVKIMICENLLTAAVSIAGGLVLGVLFSKLGELVITRLLGADINFDMEIDPRAIVTTVLLFVVIFALIMVRMLVFLWRSRPVEMLRSDKVGEKPPKGNWFFALAGIVLLGAAYYLAVTIEDPITALMWFFIAVIMVIAATYLLFIAGSVTFGRLLQKNKRYYYRTNHFVSLSSMIYRMKRNGAGLASICILSTMVLVTVSSTICLFVQAEDGVNKRYPQDIFMRLGTAGGTALNEEDTAPYINAVEEILAEHGEAAENLQDYRMYSMDVYQDGADFQIDLNQVSQIGMGNGEIRSVYVIRLEDYNTISGSSAELGDNEVFIYPYKMNYDYDTVDFEGLGTWKAEKLDTEPFCIGEADANALGSLFLVVKDISVMDQMCEVKNESLAGEWTSSIQRCYGFDLACGDEKQSEIYNGIMERFTSMDSGVSWYTESKAQSRAEYVALFGGLFFLGILLGAVFLFGTVLIMYYKQISEGYEDQNRFDILMKVGMSRKEVKQSINSQVLTVFFLPLIAAGVHMAFAFPLISRILKLITMRTDENVFLLVTVCCYLVFALFYVIVYWVTSKSYYTIVSAAKKDR